MIFILVSSLLYGAVMPFAVSSLATPDVEPKHGYLNFGIISITSITSITSIQ
jgi:hypothetical protein